MRESIDRKNQYLKVEQALWDLHRDLHNPTKGIMMKSLKKLPMIQQWLHSRLGLLFWNTAYTSRRAMNNKMVRMAIDLHRPVNDMLNVVHQERSPYEEE